MISFIFSFEIINVFIPDPILFLKIAAFTVDAAAVNPNGYETLLANGFSMFLIKSYPVFHNVSITLPKNASDFPVYMENHSHHYSHQGKLIKVSKLLQHHFLFLILLY